MCAFVQRLRLAGYTCVQVCSVLPAIFLSTSIVFSSALPIKAIASAEIYPLDLERQPLELALNKLAEIAGFNWGTSKLKYVEGESATPLKGYYTARQAVAELFRDAGIQYQWTDEDNLSITGKNAVKVSSLPKPVVRRQEIEEITVVGSHIRGSNPAVPVFQFDRKYIQNTGLSTTHEFLSSMPQVFGGGAVEGVVPDIKGEGAKFNIADANGVNLRGMGYDTTLVLLNGRRMAPVGYGDVVDVSDIPLNAIDRIEVMTDGASAIYGSDAVGGVVNIILRRSYQGMETQMGYGDVTTGSRESYRFGHTFGQHWSSGNALFSYNYQQRANLSTADRSSTKNVAAPSDILGENTQHNAIFSVAQQLTERTGVYVDALYSRRETEQNEANFGENIVRSRSVKQYSLIGGSNIDLGDSWRLATSVLYSGSSTVLDNTGAFNGGNKTALNTWVLDTKADGEVFDTWGGSTKLAVGGQYRQEAFTYEIESVINSDKEKSDRDIAAAFAEVFIPLTSENNQLPGLERLELTLAGRHERYSDFGGSTNPKAGLLWSPVAGLNVRATYSKSFRAPLLYELSNVANPPGASVVSLPDSLAPNDADTLTLLIGGHDTDLQAEKAVNRTFGIDVMPVVWPGFHLSLTYFTIDFTDRIQSAFEGAEVPIALIDPRYSSSVIRNPNRELIDFWVSQPYFVKKDDISLDQIGAFIDNRLRNIAVVRERGVDFALDYSLNTKVGEFAFRLSGTYLMSLESQATETSPVVDILDTPYNPVDVKLRNSISWRRDGLVATAFINYTGRYKDTNLGQARDVDAWTTVDLSMRYHSKRSENFWWQNTTFSLNINNLFDKEPPFVANDQGYNFDATNANVLGRRISLDITKQW